MLNKSYKKIYTSNLDYSRTKITPTYKYILKKTKFPNKTNTIIFVHVCRTFITMDIRCIVVV